MKKNFWSTRAIGALLLASGALVRPAQAAEPLYQETFEANDGGWTPMGDTAKVKWEQQADNVKEGKGALRFDYSIAAGQINLLGIPAPERPFATLQAITFWVKASHDAPMAFVLQEQNGGRFTSQFFAPKNKWQRVELKPADFVLQEGNDDPKDANGKLDLDKIEGAALVDFGQVLAQFAAGPNNPLAQLLNVKTGPRTLYIDDVTFSATPLAGEPAPDATLIDGFTRPQAAWFSIGDIGLQNIKDENPENNALQADYWQEPNHLVAIVKPVSRGVFVNKSGLSLNAASKQRAILIVQLEEHSGGKYNTMLEVPGKAAPTPVTLLFKDFKPADDSKDNNNRLDLDQVKQLLIIDLTGLIGQANTLNTLWLNHIHVK